jgi:photosystem II stability/assembly factor-like uncharacterized protein
MKNSLRVIVIIAVISLLSVSARSQSGWFPLKNSPIGFYSIYFVNADTGFISGNGAMRTTDGGTTWSSIPVSGGSFKFFNNKRLGVCYGGSGVDYTHDGGITWRHNPVPSVNHIEFPTDSIGFCVSFGNDTTSALLGRTRDGGRTWTFKPFLKVVKRPQPRVIGIRSLAFRDSLHGFVTEDAEAWDGSGGGSTGFGTSDGGETWFLGGGSSYQKMFLHDSTWLAAFDDGTSKTTNDFASLYYLLNVVEPLNRNYVPACCLSKADDSNIVSYNWFGSSILRSTNAGETWYFQYLTRTQFWGDISLPTTTVGYVLGIDSQIYKTIDGGGPPFTASVGSPFLSNVPVRLFPNPAHSYADLSFSTLVSSARFELFNSIGRKLLIDEVPAGKRNYHFDISRFPTGVYIARFQGKAYRFVKLSE